MSKNKKILVMGLPGSGKSYLADKLASILGAEWLNADRRRKAAKDWDFSPKGRTRPAERMKRLAQERLNRDRYVIADFVLPENIQKISATDIRKKMRENDVLK